MLKNVFLKRIKVDLLSYKLDIDLVNQIVSEIEVRYDILSQKGLSASDIVSSMGGVESIVKNYVNKFGSTEIKSVSSGLEDINSPSRNESKPSLKEILKKESIESISKKIENIDLSKPLADSVPGKFESEFEKANETIKKTVKNIDKKQKTKSGKLIGFIVVIAMIFGKNILSNDINFGRMLNNFTQSQLNPLSEDFEPVYTEEGFEAFNKMQIETDNVDLDVIVSDSYAMSVYTEGSEDFENLRDFFDINVVDGQLKVVQRVVEGSPIRKIEFRVPSDKVIDIDMKSKTGHLYFDREGYTEKVVNSIKLNTEKGGLMFYGSESCNIDFNSTLEGAYVDLNINNIDAVVKVTGASRLESGFPKYTFYDESGVKTAKFNDGRDKININIPKGNFTIFGEN